MKIKGQLSLRPVVWLGDSEKNLKQREIAVVLALKQAEVSHLLNGHFSRFSTDKLLDFLKRLNHKVTLQISPHHQGESYQQVSFKRVSALPHRLG